MAEVRRRESPHRLIATLRRQLTTDLALALTSSLLATLLACVVLEIWRAHLNVPFVYSWDGNHYAMFVKSTLDHGWIYRNPDLGAPFGQQLYDWPIASADTLQVLLIKLLGVVSSDSATVMNVYFLLTFPLAAATSYVVFRRLDCSPAASVVCSVLFALLPYHFVRGENHLFFSGYFAVPLGSYLVLAVFADEPLFTRRTNHSRRNLLAYASRRSLLTIALCAVVALAAGGPYYAAFTILLVAAGMIVALARRSMHAVLSGGVVIAVIAGVLAASLAPAILYRARHGTNEVVAKRGVKESEIQALKLTQLVLPIEHHRVGKLAHASQKYADIDQSLNQPVRAGLQRPTEASTVHLGLVATLGFASLLFVAVAGALRGSPWVFYPRYRQAAAATFTAFLIGTVGGISALVAGIVSPQLRSWNRISIFIAFFSLLAIALSLSALGRRWQASRGGRAAFAALLVVTLGLGVFDQTSASYVPDYQSITTSYRSDGVFVRATERRLGGHGSVFQLPYVPFPEGGITYRLTDYDLVRGYLHSDRLRWSFGAMSGRVQDWQGALAEQALTLQIQGAAAAGFDGIYIDRFGYPDGARSLERQIQPLVGRPRLKSPDRRLVFFDLRPLARRLARSHSPAALGALRRATLEPLQAQWTAGFGPVRRKGGGAWRQVRHEAELVIVNPSHRTRRAALQTVLATRRTAAAGATVGYPDGTFARLRATTSGTRLWHVLELAPGRNVIRLTTTASAPKSAGESPLWIQAAVRDSGFWPFAAGSQR